MSKKPSPSTPKRLQGNDSHTLIISEIEQEENSSQYFFYYLDTKQKSKRIKRIKDKNYYRLIKHRKELFEKYREDSVFEFEDKERLKKEIKNRELKDSSFIYQSVSEMILEGFSSTHIKQLLKEQFNIPEEKAYYYITRTRDRIIASMSDEIERVIPLHTQRYERIYRELRSMGLTKLPLAVLRMKEKVMMLHDVVEKISIKKNLIEFNLSKLNQLERDRLNQLVDKVKLKKVLSSKINIKSSTATIDFNLDRINQDFYYIAKREVYANSFYHFFIDAYKVLHPGERFDDNWHIRFICNVLQNELVRIQRGIPREKDIIINVPFRSTKSMICTVIFPVWCWVIRRQTKIISCSYAESVATHQSVQSKTLLDSEWFKNIYGDSYVSFKRDENTKTHYTNTYGGFRSAIGTGGAVTGKGGDILILDDPQNPKKGASEKERQNTIGFYTNTLYSRLNQPDIGVRIVIQQRLHENDLTGYLISTNLSDYRWIKIPAEIKKRTKPHPEKLAEFYKGGLFFPKRFSRKVLDGFYKVLGSYHAAGQLQQEPAPDEGGILKRSWFRIVNPEDLDIQRDPNESPIKYYLDTAESEKQKESGDRTAILSCFKYKETIYITHVVAVKKEFSELVKYIPQYVQGQGYTNFSTVKIEPKSSGKSIVSQLRASTKLNVSELKAPTDDKITRASAIQPIIESRRVVLINGAWVEDFLQEVTTFPNATHDDRVDVLIYAVEDLISDAGFDFAFI